jgi:SIR2-like domain
VNSSGETSRPRNLGMLIGNGLSLAFNPELNIRVISEEIVRRVRQDAGEKDADAIATAMQRAAAATGGGNPMLDFEVLVGAFVTEGSFMERLGELASYIDPNDVELSSAFARISGFSESLRWRGVSHVLEVVAERTVASLGLKADLNTFIDLVVASYSGTITLGNLNYDTLVLSSLMENHGGEFCDLALGYNPATISFEGGLRFPIYQLRTALNFPNGRRIRLLSLHGSLTWWRNHKDGSVYKFPVEEVRRPTIWSTIRQHDYDEGWYPEVVLANQSSKVYQVLRPPFSLAYEGLRRSLETSDDWLIVGYSFRDVPVNALLREAFDAKTSRPNVLVVTKGQLPTRTEIEHALSWSVAQGSSSTWLRIIRDGAESIVQTDLIG